MRVWRVSRKFALYVFLEKNEEKNEEKSGSFHPVAEECEKRR
jgi:hypothetical protein